MPYPANSGGNSMTLVKLIEPRCKICNEKAEYTIFLHRGENGVYYCKAHAKEVADKWIEKA